MRTYFFTVAKSITDTMDSSLAYDVKTVTEIDNHVKL